MVVIVALGNLGPSETTGRMGALMFSFVPLLVVFAIALFARMSEQINLRSGGQVAREDSFDQRSSK